MGVRVSSAQILKVATGSGTAVGGTSVGSGTAVGSCTGSSGAAVGVAAPPPHADSKSPSTVMNENSVTNFFMALLLLFGILILKVAMEITIPLRVGTIHPMFYFDYRERLCKRLAKKLEIFVTKLD
jgi:hypothetical protein